jgi:hypothetical protein
LGLITSASSVIVGALFSGSGEASKPRGLLLQIISEAAVSIERNVRFIVHTGGPHQAGNNIALLPRFPVPFTASTSLAQAWNVRFSVWENLLTSNTSPMVFVEEKYGRAVVA